jgi:hypothetical protein
MKTAELSGIALDWAVAECEGTLHDDGSVPDYYQPSTDWAQGGAIIEQEGASLDYDGLGTWVATIITNGSVFEESGGTPLEAAMRCYVASKLGDEVEIPDELSTHV